MFRGQRLVRLGVGAVLAFGAIKCGGTPGEVGELTADSPMQSAQIQDGWWRVGPPETLVFVFVVDDGPEATELRSEIARSFGSYFSRRREIGCEYRPDDPAEWHPIDWTAIVVHPSATEDARFVTPQDDPRLHWVTNQGSESGAATFEGAVGEALRNYQAPAGAPYPLLRAFAEVEALLAGQVSPRTPAEQRVLDSVPAGAWSLLNLATARDDESPEGTEPATFDRLYATILVDTVIVPALQPSENPEECGRGPRDTTPRLEAWEKVDNSWHDGAFLTWPCTDLEVPSTPNLAHCQPSCFPARPIIDSEGRADCRIQVKSAQNACPSELGWLDPLDTDGVRRERIVADEDGVALRLCDVTQLSGDELQACRSSLDCRGCGPGWCWTEVPELMPACGAPQGGVEPAFRFIGGARNAVPGLMKIVCNLEHRL